MRRRGYFGHHFEEIEKKVKEYDRPGNCSLDFVRNHRILTPFDRAKRMKAVCKDCFKTDPAPGSLRNLFKINIELYSILFFFVFHLDFLFLGSKLASLFLNFERLSALSRQSKSG